MSDNENDIEPSSPILQGNENSNKAPGVFSGLELVLSEEDYANHGVHKLIVHMLAKSYEENAYNKQEMQNLIASKKTLEENYHNVSIDLAVYKEKLRKYKFWECFDALALTIGALLLGLTLNENIELYTKLLGGILVVLSVFGKCFLYSGVKDEDKK